MRISFITDEATQNLDEAISLALDLGLQGLELRSVEDTPIDRVDPAVLKTWKARLDKAGLRVSNLAGSFNKCPIAPEGTPQPELRKLERLCRAADILDCDTIRGFAFFAEPSGPAVTGRTVSAFAAPAAILKKYKKKLLLESDPTVNTTNHMSLAELLQKLDDSVFGTIYDPGNDIYDPSGEVPFPAGYFAVRKTLGHIHIKDAVLSGGKPQCVKIGTGLVDYRGLFRQLKLDGYSGWLSLETHYRTAAILTEEQMRLPQGSSFSHGGMEAMAESAEALKQLLAEVLF